MMIQKRVTSFFVAVLAAGALFFLPDSIFILAVFLLTALAMEEYFTLLAGRVAVFKIFGISAGLVVVSFHFLSLPQSILLSILLVLGLFLLYSLRVNNRETLVGISTTLFGIFYFGYLFGFSLKIRMLAQGTVAIAFLLMTVKSSDLGAYLVGTRFGRVKLIPRITPRKTRAGAAGGLLFSIAFALISKAWFAHQFSFTEAIGLGVALGVFAQLGDLAESLIKRDCGAGASSRLIPGLGGILDMVDSLIFTLPLFYLYLLYSHRL